ncbi:hypothetical protein EGM51_06950 [Verrucomicrobia bacterium S94]|nr:hypothetical protein EGM51_06950 [Verrucomicrobia bacterium S94]
MKELTWDPGSTQSGTEVYTHTDTREDSYLFRITTANTPANQGFWRTVLNVSAGNADLYTDAAANVSPDNREYESELAGSDTIIQPLTAGQEKFILVEAEEGASWSLFAGDIHLTELTWDPGLADAGTEVFNNLNTDGGVYYFKITTELPDLAAWRTALDVLSGEADLLIRQNALPYTNSYNYSYTDHSVYVGDDGFTRYLSETSGSGQEWYIAVLADAGSTWNLLSGDVYAEDLGALAAGSGSGSGVSEIPPEGIRYFKTTIPAAAYAWRLWLQDASGTGTLNIPFYVRNGLAPHPSSNSYYDRTRTGQGLLVPDYVVPGSASYYYVGISGVPGEQFRLDSRQQEIIDTTYNNTLVGQSASGFLYRTYRVPVPPEQIAWEVTAEPSAGTNPELAVRLDKVPNAFNNDAFSEIDSTSEGDSITLVPASLSDGSYYVTVYGDTDFSFNLRNREPVITQIDFFSSTLNNDPLRAGWRYFAVSDIGQQLGQLGWLLDLSNFVPGTEIAIRRNFVPGRWNYRKNGSTSVFQVAHNDQTSSLGYLQDPDHEADIWYVGIYSPDAALGAFTLNSGNIQPAAVTVDGFSAGSLQVAPLTWQFYHVDIPAELNGQDILGWELRVNSWSGQRPTMVIRRDEFPDTTGTYAYWRSTATWPSGYRWSTSTADWSGFYRSSDGSQNYPEYLLSMAMGHPLEPGSYYIGFYNSSTSTTSTYSFVSSAVGNGMTYEPQPVAFNGGSAVITDLAPRDVRYFRVEVPTNTGSWRVHLENTVGESSLFIRKDYVPNIAQYQNPTYSPDQSLSSLPTFRKSGDEYYTLLPASGETTIPGGTYYLMVVSEGQNPSGSNIGTGTSGAVLHSLGEVVIQDLGTVPVAGELSDTQSYAAGEVNLMEFTVPAGVLALEVRLEDRVGSPEMNLRTDGNMPNGASYGQYSGYTYNHTDTELITIANPPSGTYSLMINDSRSGNSVSAGSYTLRVVTVGASEIQIDGGGDAGVVIPPNEWRYYHMDIPEQTNGQDILGWELRVNSWSGQQPTMVIKRDELPDAINSTSWTHWRSAGSWTSGYQWSTSTADWSGFYRSSDGSQNYPEYLLSMAMGRPLEPGSYYIGFYNSSTSATSTYSFVSSAIGTGMSYDPQPVAFNGGSAVITDLAPRDVRYFRVEVPTNTGSWRVHLENTVGESSLFIRKDYVPNIAQYQNPTYSPDQSVSYLPTFRKSGDEYYTLLPASGETTIPGGTYYLMVVSEGQNPSGNNIGTGTSGAVLRSLGEAVIQDLGTVPVAGELSDTQSYAAGEVNLMEFTVPAGVLALEVRLEDRVGSPEMNLRTDGNMPNGASYGQYSGYTYNHTDTELITIANPPSGTYSLMINDSRSGNSVSAGSYTLRVVTVGASEIQIDGGGDAGVVIPPNEWRYYHMDIPEQTNGQDILGWELRVNSWSGQQPTMVIKRDELPDAINSTSWTHWRSAGSWTSGYQWSTSTADWSGFYRSSDGSQNYPEYLLSMAMGRPLEPGSYYIGFYNSSTSTTSTYSFVSSAVGNGMTYEPQPVAFNGGSAVITDLAPRDVRYFRVEVPTNTGSWRVHLENTVGESSLFIRKDYVPNIAQYQNPTYSPDQSVSYLPTFRKSGDEYYTLLPASGETTIPGGTYYLMVVSEGQNPSGSNIGTGTSGAVLRSLGEAVVDNLGLLPVAGSLIRSNNYEAGEADLYRFTVQSGTLGVQVRLENVSGMPELNLRTDSAFPNGLSYGLYSGNSSSYTDPDIITIPNPTEGLWSLVIGDRNNEGSLVNGEYQLVIEDLVPPDLNIDAVLNTNGNSNVASATLVDDERIFYRVDVPDVVDGNPVAGWYLTTSVTRGDAQVRARKDLLPAGNQQSYQTYFRSDALMVVPPFLSPGTWYVEVKGVGATDFTLTSSVVIPERSWIMPSVGETISTPGLSVPLFGDSGVNEAGLPLPVDQGVDLNNGFYHIYAVTVPENNAGLLRTQLEAISGNPNLYIRAGNVPTLDHDTINHGTLYDRYLNSTANTEYGNWVPYDGRYADSLEPGIWYLMVKAEGTSNARYRLKVSGGNSYAGGNVQELTLDGESYTGQLLADNDWRHYRVEVPTNAPVNWEITYSQASGNVDMFIRDTVPAGHWELFSDSTSYIRDWNLDYKNSGTPRPNYPDTGTHTLNMPPLRPGHVYYVSFFAKSDASFSVSSTVSGGTIPEYEKVDFEGGTVSTSVPAGTSITYQIDVPADAVRWIHSQTNSSALNVYLEQGTLPSQTSSDHWYRTSGSYTLNKYLRNTDGWPWRPDYTYYLTVVNPTANPEPFDLVMQGSTAAEIPANLMATDGTYLDRVSLTWNGISGISSYEVWRSLLNDSSLAIQVGTAGTSSYSDYTAVPGQLYYYWVSAGGFTNTSTFSVGDSGWRPGSGSLNTSSATFTASGGNGTVEVTASAGEFWTATESLNWITVLSGSPGTNNGTVAYSIGAYAGSLSRTGTITVASQTFTVIQHPLEIPVDVSATDGDYEDHTVITWDLIPEATYYYLYRGTTSNELSAAYIGNTVTNIYNDIGGAVDQLYYYWVRPYNGGGIGGFSQPDTGFRGNLVVSSAWKMQYFPGGYPGDQVDSDGDGFLNIEEFIADTIPTNALSYFRIDNQYETQAGFVIEWNSVSGRVYGVSWIDGLTNGLTPLTNGIPYPQSNYTDTVHNTGNEGFYRLNVELK